MSATEIANAYVALYTKMPGVEGDIKKSLGGADSAFDSAGSASGAKFSAAAALSIAAGAAAVGVAVGVVVGKAVMSFGELEQNLGGSEAVFGQYADVIQSKGTDAYKNLGLSQSDYLSTANKMGALFQGSGIEQEKALNLTTDAMQRAADMASVMGIDQTFAMESVTGAAKGNFTMMDNLGVAMNATSVEAYAAAQGMTDWSYATATSAEKAEMAMAMFMDSTSQYAGNFAKEATETVTGSIGLMGSAWESLVAGLGNPDADMGQLTTNLVDAFSAVVSNLLPVIGEIFASLPEVFSTMGEKLGGALQTALDGAFGDTIFGKIIGEVAGGITALVAAFQAGGNDITSSGFAGILETVGLLARNLWDAFGPLITQAFELYTQFSPLSLIFQALEPVLPLLVDAFDMVAGAIAPLIEKILPVVSALFQQIIPIVMQLVGALVPLLEPILGLLDPLLQLISTLLPPLVEFLGFVAQAAVFLVGALVDLLVPAVTAVVSAISGILIPIVNYLQDVMDGIIKFITGVFTGDWEQAWQGIVDIFSGMWNGLVGLVKGIINGIIDLVNGAIGGINNLAGSVSDITGGAISLSIPTIPHLAEGGLIKARPGGVPAVVGEGRYDEMVVPLSPSVLSMLGTGGGGGGVNLTVNGAPGQSEYEIGRIAAAAVDWELRTA